MYIIIHHLLVNMANSPVEHADPTIAKNTVKRLRKEAKHKWLHI